MKWNEVYLRISNTAYSSRYVKPHIQYTQSIQFSTKAFKPEKKTYIEIALSVAKLIIFFDIHDHLVLECQDTVEHSF